MNRILIVANSLAKMNLGEFLERKGYSVVMAEDGVTAQSKLQRERFDLVITEMAIFRLNGLDLIKYMQECEFHKDIPTIVLILPWESSAISLIQQQGAFGILTVPYHREELLSLISEALTSQSIGQN